MGGVLYRLYTLEFVQAGIWNSVSGECETSNTRHGGTSFFIAEQKPDTVRNN